MRKVKKNQKHLQVILVPLFIVLAVIIVALTLMVVRQPQTYQQHASGGSVSCTQDGGVCIPRGTCGACRSSGRNCAGGQGCNYLSANSVCCKR